MTRHLLAIAATLLAVAPASAQLPQVGTYCLSGGEWVPCTSGGGGGGGGGTTTDPDDASIASGQTNDNVNALTMAFDGSVWRRLTFGSAGAASSQVLTVQGIASMTPILVAGSVTPADSVSNPTNTAPVSAYLMSWNGTTWDRAQSTHDECDGGTKVTVTINQTADTQLWTGTASNRSYICSILIRQPATSTQTFNLVSGTGSTCGTSVGPVIGGTTAAHGSASQFVLGNGSGLVAITDTDGDNVCLLQSSTDRLTGVITYVVAPAP